MIRNAIAQIEVPEHGPDFWDRLEARLAESSGTNRAGPAQVLVTYEVPLSTNGRRTEVSRQHRWGRRALWVGLAAGFVLLVGGVVLFNRGGGTETAEVLPIPTNRPATPTPSAVEAVDAFLAALADGNTDSAWSMLAPRSQGFWQSKERFATMRTGLAEGLSTWLSAERHRVMTMTLAGAARGGDRTEAVIIEGSRRPEGMLEHTYLAVAAYYRADRGTYVLDPGQMVSAATIEVLEPRPVEGRPTPMRPDGRFIVRVDDPNTEVVLEFDDGGEFMRRPAPDGVVEWQPDAPLSPGEHLVGVAYLAADGSAYVTGIPVLVE